jgi:preprotein translocase subunit SecB
MTTETGIDFAAVSRVARRIDLLDIRVVEVSAHCAPAPPGPLVPEVTYDCHAESVGNAVTVLLKYKFRAESSGTEVARVLVAYILVYEVLDEKSIAEPDLEQFARANGIYHSWPFFRQFLFDLTSKMGFPPFTLPVFRVQPGGKASAQEPQAREDVPKKTKRQKALK